jgi:hypothetical protein
MLIAFLMQSNVDLASLQKVAKSRVIKIGRRNRRYLITLIDTP